jgi:transcriptional regulator GlxA family with amidase domain
MRDEGVLRAQAVLAARLGEKVGLDELAAAAGLGKFQLLRRFRAVTGMTPGTYRRRLRIEGAKLALARGESPSQVALAFGFVDQSHFTRAFRLQTGETPGRFARARTPEPVA